MMPLCCLAADPRSVAQFGSERPDHWPGYRADDDLPDRLRTLLAMLRVYAENFYHISKALTSLTELMPPGPDESPVPPSAKQAIRPLLQQTWRNCQRSGL